MSHHFGSKKTPAGDVIALRKQVADLKDSAIARRRVEDALRAAEMLHRATLEESPVGILRLDLSGSVLYLNLAFIGALGYKSRQEFTTIGELRGIFQDQSEVRRAIHLATEQPTEAVFHCFGHDGEVEALRLMVGRSGEGGVTLVHPHLR